MQDSTKWRETGRRTFFSIDALLNCIINLRNSRIKKL